MVEDAPAGVSSARAAGCPVIGVLTTHASLDAPSVPSLADVRFTAGRRRHRGQHSGRRSDRPPQPTGTTCPAAARDEFDDQHRRDQQRPAGDGADAPNSLPRAAAVTAPAAGSRVSTIAARVALIRDCAQLSSTIAAAVASTARKPRPPRSYRQRAAGRAAAVPVTRAADRHREQGHAATVPVWIAGHGQRVFRLGPAGQQHQMQRPDWRPPAG